MTRWVCLACVALLAFAVPVAAASKPRHVAQQKKHKHAKRARWRASTSALRFAGPGVLSGGLAGSSPDTPASSPGSLGKPSEPTGTPTAPVYHTLSVSSREFSLTLSRQLLTPGTQTIQLNNRGEDPHDLVVGPDDGSGDALAVYPEVESLQSHAEQVELPAGRYKLWCSLPGHEALGMRATLRVE